jgi:hypothetical protein
MMMQPYKGYFIDGSALMTHPFSPDRYVCLRLRSFHFNRGSHALSASTVHRQMKELAEWFGLEVARIVVDECLAERES